MTEPLKIQFNGAKAAARLGVVSKEGIQRFKRAVGLTTEKVASEIKRRGNVDIQRAGNFSRRWTDAFTVEPSHSGMRSTITAYFSGIDYGHVHEFGATIRGKPLLWIPLPWTGIEVRARDYPGGLFKVQRRSGGNPLLLSKVDKQPKYVGVPHVTLRPRFHIRQIAANVVRTELAKMFHGFHQGGK